MSLTGKVQNGVIVLPADAQLPEGTEVNIVRMGPLPGDPLFLQAVLKLAKPRDWPVNFALNRDHHTTKCPKE